MILDERYDFGDEKNRTKIQKKSGFLKLEILLFLQKMTPALSFNKNDILPKIG
jgi:hypothetical protein